MNSNNVRLVISKTMGHKGIPYWMLANSPLSLVKREDSQPQSK